MSFHTQRSTRPRTIQAPPSQESFVYQAAAPPQPRDGADKVPPTSGVDVADSPPRTKFGISDHHGALSDPWEGLSEAEIEARYAYLSTRLASRAEAVQYRSDEGPYSVRHNSGGDALYEAWMAANPSAGALTTTAQHHVALVTQHAESAVQLEIFMRDVLYYHVVEAAFVAVDRREREAVEAYEAAVRRREEEEVALREALRLAAAEAQRQRSEERRQAHLHSSDPFIAEIRRQAAERIRQQDEEAAAREEEELRRLDERVAAMMRTTVRPDDDSSVAVVHADSQNTEQEPRNTDLDDVDLKVRWAPGDVVATSSPPRTAEAEDVDDDELQARREALAEQRARVLAGCVNTATRIAAPSISERGREAVRAESKPVPPAANTVNKVPHESLQPDAPEGIPIVFERQSWRQKAELKQVPQHHRHDFISTATID